MSSSAEPIPVPTANVDPNAPTKTYAASCHCGTVKFAATVSPPLDEGHEVASCNCSICTSNGYLLVYLADSAVAFESGEDQLKYYSFKDKKVAHSFCPNCGTSLFVRSIKPGFFDGMKAVNVRTFKDIDVDSLKLKKVGGKSF